MLDVLFSIYKPLGGSSPDGEGADFCGVGADVLHGAIWGRGVLLKGKVGAAAGGGVVQPFGRSTLRWGWKVIPNNS